MTTDYDQFFISLILDLFFTDHVYSTQSDIKIAFFSQKLATGDQELHKILLSKGSEQFFHH